MLRDGAATMVAGSGFGGYGPDHFKGPDYASALSQATRRACRFGWMPIPDGTRREGTGRGWARCEADDSAYIGRA